MHAFSIETGQKPMAADEKMDEGSTLMISREMKVEERA